MTIDAHDHPGPHSTGLPIETVIGLALLATVAALYLLAAHRQRAQPRGWSHWRTFSFLAGLAILATAIQPSDSHDFTSHMLGHLLIGMFAPLGLVLGAPITLILRSIPPRTGRTLVHVLRSTPAKAATHPAVLLVANIGGLAVLYFTPVFGIADSNPALHTLIHVHFFVAGYLFAWMITGPDPGPDRPTVRTRLVVLGIAIAGHAVIAQLLYAGLFVQVEATPDDLRAGGTLMYYWGDIAEIILALSLLLTWKPNHHNNTGRSVLLRTAPELHA